MKLSRLFFWRKRKRAHRISASRSHTDLNAAERAFASTYAENVPLIGHKEALKLAASAAGLSRRTANAWMKKWKISDAVLMGFNASKPETTA